MSDSEKLIREVGRYHTLLDTLAPLPRGEDGFIDVYEVIWDDGGTFSTPDQEQPVRQIRCQTYRELQDCAARQRLQIANLASFTHIPHDTSMGTVQYVCCDLIE